MSVADSLRSNPLPEPARRYFAFALSYDRRVIKYARVEHIGEMALRLGYVFGTTPDFWLNLQSEFDLRVVRNQKEAKVKSQVRPLEVHA